MTFDEMPSEVPSFDQMVHQPPASKEAEPGRIEAITQGLLGSIREPLASGVPTLGGSASAPRELPPEEAAAKAAHPGFYTGGQVGGTFAPMALSAAAAKILRVMPRFAPGRAFSALGGENAAASLKGLGIDRAKAVGASALENKLVSPGASRTGMVAKAQEALEQGVAAGKMGPEQQALVDALNTAKAGEAGGFLPSKFDLRALLPGGKGLASMIPGGRAVQTLKDQSLATGLYLLRRAPSPSTAALGMSGIQTLGRLRRVGGMIYAEDKDGKKLKVIPAMAEGASP